MIDINELSSHLLAKYVHKATSRAMDIAHNSGNLKHKSGQFHELIKQGKKRLKGIKRATNKLADKATHKAVGDQVEKDIAAHVQQHFGPGSEHSNSESKPAVKTSTPKKKASPLAKKILSNKSKNKTSKKKSVVNTVKKTTDSSSVPLSNQSDGLKKPKPHFKLKASAMSESEEPKKEVSQKIKDMLKKREETLKRQEKHDKHFTKALDKALQNHTEKHIEHVIRAHFILKHLRAPKTMRHNQDTKKEIGKVFENDISEISNGKLENYLKKAGRSQSSFFLSKDKKDKRRLSIGKATWLITHDHSQRKKIPYMEGEVIQLDDFRKKANHLYKKGMEAPKLGSMNPERSDFIPKKKSSGIIGKIKSVLNKEGLDEEFPTNAMGTSSSTQGPVQTFDPLLFNNKKKVIRRKQPKTIGKIFKSV